MLILRRKSGESLLIGKDVKITIMEVNEGSVRIAIDAPKEITILRSELVQAADANRDAAKAEAKPELLSQVLNLDSKAGQQKSVHQLSMGFLRLREDVGLRRLKNGCSFRNGNGSAVDGQFHIRHCIAPPQTASTRQGVKRTHGLPVISSILSQLKTWPPLTPSTSPSNFRP